MPKEARSTILKLKSYVSEFKDEGFATDGKVLFCNTCQSNVNIRQRFLINQHISTAKHQAGRKRNAGLTQTFVLQPTNSSKRVEFNTDLCRALIGSDIPLWKVNSPAFRQFLEKYTTNSVPDQSTLRKNYSEQVYQETLEKIRTEISENSIWVSLDETTDAEGRCIGNVVIGSMNSETACKPILLTSELMEKCNNKTVAKLFNDAMGVLWPDGIKHDRVLLLVTDAASYMIKAAEALKVLFPKIIHLTCSAHAFHRIAETVRVSFPKVDQLISNGKKIFLKAPSRIQIMKEMYPEIPLPPRPVLTRWGTWLEAVEYYVKHFEAIKNVLDSLNPESAASIDVVKSLLSDQCVKNDLCYIHANFSNISKTIQKLQNNHLTLSENINTVKDTICKLKSTHGKIADLIKTKVDNVFSKNPGFEEMCKITAILRGTSNVQLESDATPADIVNFKYAPITSCDVERSFSQYKSLLRDNRRSFTFENLKQHFVAYCFNSRVN